MEGAGLRRYSKRPRNAPNTNHQIDLKIQLAILQAIYSRAQDDLGYRAEGLGVSGFAALGCRIQSFRFFNLVVYALTLGYPRNVDRVLGSTVFLLTSHSNL